GERLASGGERLTSEGERLASLRRSSSDRLASIQAGGEARMKIRRKRVNNSVALVEFLRR
ncbi:MAG TPA: hypothetical protein VL025_14680, partial [Thermoanaerobaculia bacterium]|nr:hypothetical protein [Thermoanaerobaculia bacterium]